MQPRRWVIERSFGWIVRCGRLARDRGPPLASALAFFVIAASMFPVCSARGAILFTTCPLGIVLHDDPIRHEISWIGIPSRNAQRLITLSYAMLITSRPSDG